MVPVQLSARGCIWDPLSNHTSSTSTFQWTVFSDGDVGDDERVAVLGIALACSSAGRYFALQQIRPGGSTDLVFTFYTGNVFLVAEFPTPIILPAGYGLRVDKTTGSGTDNNNVWIWTRKLS